MNVESDLLVHHTNEVLVLDMMNYVQRLNTKYGKYFIDPEEGIYVVNRTTPLLTSKSAYYTQKGYAQRVPLTSLDNVKEAVVDENGAVIIPQYMMLRKDKFLRATPNLPVRAIQIAELIAKEYIDSMLPHVAPYDYQSDLLKLVKPAGRALVRDGYFESICRRMIVDISLFVRADIWNLYFYRQDNTDLIVQKGVDYRIWKWTKEQEEKQEKALARENEIRNS